MIVGVIVDRHFRPVCSEDVAWQYRRSDNLVPVIDQQPFRNRPRLVVADRGMISADAIAALERRGLEYILGAMRERCSRRSAEPVMVDTAPSVPAGDPGQGRPDTELQAKEVKVGDRRLYRLPQPGRGHRCRTRRGGRGGNVTRQATARRQESPPSATAPTAPRLRRTPASSNNAIDEDRIAEDAAATTGSISYAPTPWSHPLNAMLPLPARLLVWWSSCSARTKPCCRPADLSRRPTRRSAAMSSCELLGAGVLKRAEEQLAAARLKR